MLVGFMTIKLAASLTLSTIEPADPLAHIPVNITIYFSRVCARSRKVVPPASEYSIEFFGDVPGVFLVARLQHLSYLAMKLYFRLLGRKDIQVRAGRSVEMTVIAKCETKKIKTFFSHSDNARLLFIECQIQFFEFILYGLFNRLPDVDGIPVPAWP